MMGTSLNTVRNSSLFKMLGADSVVSKICLRSAQLRRLIHKIYVSLSASSKSPGSVKNGKWSVQKTKQQKKDVGQVIF